MVTLKWRRKKERNISTSLCSLSPPAFYTHTFSLASLSSKPSLCNLLIGILQGGIFGLMRVHRLCAVELQTNKGWSQCWERE